jgi:type I restriction enzyme S subunit
MESLPSHWEVIRLRFVMWRIEQGWSPLCHNQQAEDDEWGVLKVGCVNGTSFDPNENKALPADLEPRAHYEIRTGDILMSRANTKSLLGSAAIVKQTRPRLLLCDKLYRLVVSKRIDPDYAVLMMRTDIARFQYERAATGTSGSMQNIGQDTIKDLLIPLPPLPEQRAIVAMLDRETARIDALIEKKRRLLELLEEKRLAVITHAVTKGLDPFAPMKDSGIDWLGQIPAHWEVKRTKFTTSFITSGSRGWAEYYSDEGPLFLQSGNLGTRMGLDFSFEQRVSPPVGAEGRRTTVNRGDVLVCITGARTGAVAHVSVDLGEAYINQHVALLRPIGSHMYPRFLAYSLWSNIGREQLWLSSYGMKEGLALQHVLAVQIASPPLSEQEAIADRLDREQAQADWVTKKISEAIDRLREYRSALITNAVTGKIDVREHVAQEAAE